MIEMAMVGLIVVAFVVAIFTSRGSHAFGSDDNSSRKVKVPEDSVLKRHFLSTLRARVESEFHPRPTDSTLKRHYDSLIHHEVQNRLIAE